MSAEEQVSDLVGKLLEEISGLTRELAEAKAGAARKMVISYDAADESFIFSDHGEHYAEIRECPGCRFDVVSENAREAVSEYDAVVAAGGEGK